MKNIYLILALAIGTFSFGQGLAYPGGSLRMLRDVEDNKIVEGSSEEIEGSKYAKTNFLPATISPFGTKIFSVRYNTVDDEFEVLKGENEVIILDKNGNNNEITVGQKKYVNLDGGYFVEVFKSDAFAIYKKETKKYNPKQPARSSYDKPKKAYYDEKISEQYFISKNENGITPFKFNNKGIRKIFPKHDKKIKSYIKTNDTDLDNNEDLKKLFDFISSL